MSLFEVPGVTDTPAPEAAKAANTPIAEVATEAVADADADDDIESEEDTDGADSQDAAA